MRDMNSDQSAIFSMSGTYPLPTPDPIPNTPNQPTTPFLTTPRHTENENQNDADQLTSSYTPYAPFTPIKTVEMENESPQTENEEISNDSQQEIPLHRTLSSSFSHLHPFHSLMSLFISIWNTILSTLLSIFFFFFYGLHLHIFFKTFCPDIYWACVRPVRARSDYYELRNTVLSSKIVLETVGFEIQKTQKDVRNLTRNGYQPIQNRNRMAKAKKIYAAMAAKPRVVVLRLMAYFLRKTWRWLYPLGIHISDEEIRPILEAARNGPLLYLPTHKSHVDSLFVTYICFEYGLPIPYVVAGDNLNLPVIGSFIRYAGGVFYPHTADDLSLAVFGEYIRTLLQRQFSVECFIEGGRSRSGKVLQPKVMMLKRVIDWVLDDNGDVCIVPISLTYERIVENDAHLEELAGEPKRVANSLQTISSVLASSLMNVTCYGRVDLRIAPPFSVSVYLHTIADQMNAIPKYSEMSTPEIRHHLTLSTGYQTLFLCNKVSVAEPAALISTVLLTQSTRGISRHRLKKEVMWIRDLIIAHGGRVADLREEYIDVVLSLILEPIVGDNQLVKKHKNLLMVDLYSPKERMELSLYENQIIHHFVQAGLVSLAFYKQERVSTKESRNEIGKNRVVVTVEELIKDVKFLSSLLKYEFIYPPSHSIEKTIRDALTFLAQLGVFKWVGEGQQCVSVCTSDSAQETYLFYPTLFWRFLDSYWLVCLGFFLLLPNRILCESLFINYIQTIGENLYFQGQLDLFEAIAKETLLNAISLFINWKVIEHLTIEGSTHSSDMSHIPGRRVLRLTQEYQKEQALEGLVAQIGAFRKCLRAYRSRRYMVRHTNEIKDAIYLVKREIKGIRSPGDTPPDTPQKKKRGNRRKKDQTNEGGRIGVEGESTESRCSSTSGERSPLAKSPFKNDTKVSSLNEQQK
jgi:glycerol-3-phosphate O-acyltransferase